MQTVGLFYGTRTGETMEVAEMIQEAFKEHGLTDVTLIDIADARVRDMDNYPNLILGSSTYRSGDLEPSWETVYPDLKAYDFSEKTVALFGLGNQFEYADTFASGMGLLARSILSGNGKLIGYWAAADYMFDYSYAMADEDHFYGLVLDQDYDADLTEERVEEWVRKIVPEFK